MWWLDTVSVFSRSVPRRRSCSVFKDSPFGSTRYPGCSMLVGSPVGRLPHSSLLWYRCHGFCTHFRKSEGSAPPVTPCILFSLIQLSRSVDSSPEYITFSCAFLFAFFLMARISNIVPLSTRSFDCRKHLCRGDIVSAPHGLTVAFKWSKTNQTGIRHLLLPLVAMPNSPLCPVKMFHRMCALTPASPMSPAFVLSSPDGSLSPVIKRQFVQVFRERLFSAAIPHAHTYRGHSFRRGGANWAFQCEVPGELIQVFGDWSSDAYKSYLEFSLPAKLRVAQRVSSSLLFS